MTTTASKAGRPRWWVAGLSLFVAVAAALVWVVVRDDTYSADLAPGATPSTPSAAVAARSVQELSQAWAAGDVDAARALAPEGDAAAADLLGEVAANVRDLGITGLSMRYVDQAGATAPDGSWPADVDLSWQVGGQDRVPARVEVRVELAGDGARVVGLGGEEGRTPVWLTGRVDVQREDGAVVLVDTDLGPQAAARYAALVRRAVPAVRRVVPGWDGRVVVEVPDSPTGVDRALGVAPGTYERVAAVTGSADGTTAPGAPVRVLVNPDELGRLGRLGAQVVMTHEVAHVALGAATSSGAVPVWLTEGVADVVALRDVDLPVSQKAGQVIAQVRRDGVPDHLPGEAEFDTVTGSHLGAAYEAAWLACEVVADRAGVPALVAVYRAVERGVPVDRALRSRAGLDQARLLGLWRQRLQDLAA